MLMIRPDAHEAPLRALQRGEILSDVQIGQYAGSDATEGTAGRIGRAVIKRLEEQGRVVARIPVAEGVVYELRPELKRLLNGHVAPLRQGS